MRRCRETGWQSWCSQNDECTISCFPYGPCRSTNFCRSRWRVIAEKEAVDRAAEVKQQFISVASHELRTPLFSVTGYAELLSRTNLTDEQVSLFAFSSSGAYLTVLHVQSLYIQNVLSACSSVCFWCLHRVGA